MNDRTILSLCDYSGNWSRPYREAGYEVVQVDIQHGEDVRLMRHLPGRVHGILAAPPCTHFSRAGAHLWAAKGEAAILEGLAVVDACLRAVAIYRPTWWVLENPIGRLKDYLGEPAFKFDPCDFGDPYTKRTWLWGHFTPPQSSVMRGRPLAVASRSCRGELDRQAERAGQGKAPSLRDTEGLRPCILSSQRLTPHTEPTEGPGRLFPPASRVGSPAPPG